VRPHEEEDDTWILAELVKGGNVAAVEARLAEVRRLGGDQAVRAEVTNCEDGAQDTRVALSSLHVAARRGLLDMLELLLNTKADPNVLNDQWNTPLHCAAESGRAESVEMLLEAGGDASVRNSFGRMPEELAFVKPFDSREMSIRKAAAQKVFRKLGAGHGGPCPNVAPAQPL
jgi:hypothetical protein